MQKRRNEELDRLSVAEFKNHKKTEIVVILDNVRSLNNIGSIFRTCDAFLIKKLFLCGISTCPPHRDIHKTALGAEESVDWEYFTNTIDCVQTLKNQGYRIVSIEQVKGSTLLSNFKHSEKPLALILGHEVKGVDQRVVDLCDECLEIPQYGTKHSFNVAVSAGIVLWEVANH